MVVLASIQSETRYRIMFPRPTLFTFTRDSKPFLLQKKNNYHVKILVDVPSRGNKLIFHKTTKVKIKSNYLHFKLKSFARNSDKFLGQTSDMIE